MPGPCGGARLPGPDIHGREKCRRQLSAAPAGPGMVMTRRIIAAADLLGGASLRLSLRAWPRRVACRVAGTSSV
eukprot:7930738-Pyramimonas_sp.AAC.1